MVDRKGIATKIMKINLIAVGKRMPDWIDAGYQEYAKRLKHPWQLTLTEIPLQTRHKSSDLTKLIQQEGSQMLQAITPKSRVITLTIDGELWDTPGLAQRLQNWHDQGMELSLLVGGPDGLAPECLQRAQGCWSLSRLTLPHPLVRVIIAEQLYRAWSILLSHPYHR